MKLAAVIFDRDGVLNEDTGYTHRVEDLRWMPGAISAIRMLNSAGVKVIVATNQSGVARGLFDEDAVHRFHGAMQAELDQVEVEGSSGGGLVTVRLSGKGEMKAIKIDDTLIKPSEKEIVEDLIVAAHADARRKAETVLQEKMKSVTGGLPIPPGLKLF